MKFQKIESELKAYIDGTISEYDILTESEMRKINNLNSNNGYGISRDELLQLAKKHEKARAEFDVKTMAKIKYRLTDINFHTECGLMHKGDYKVAYECIKQW